MSTVEKISSASLTDTFITEGLPSIENQADYLFEGAELDYPEHLNCIDLLVQKHIDEGHGNSIAIRGSDLTWSYFELDVIVNQIANVLTGDYGLIQGNRVLLRGANSPYLAAVWLAVVKAGLIAVTTMPLMRARDLRPVIEKAKVDLAVCQSNLKDELDILKNEGALEHVITFETDGNSGSLITALNDADVEFIACSTKATDVALVAFTSGTTGKQKGCVHFHRDVISMAVCFSQNILEPTTSDVFIGSPPLAFTFGLGALLVFPLYAGSSVVLIEKPAPASLADAIKSHKATISFTSPTGYNAMLEHSDKEAFSSLRLSVAAGEHLNPNIYEAWTSAIGIPMINGIGSTEMIHIFVSTTPDEAMPGLTGTAIPGYQACIMDESHQVLEPGNDGLLAVKGPTGCKYFDDERQHIYVHNGWNITGDLFHQDEEGRFWFKGRSDDMIVSSGYNISSLEVEEVINGHPAVEECAVIGIPDTERGKLVKAVIVLNPGYMGTDHMVKAIQDFVKKETSPYKYPRAIQFIRSLPKTETGKIQRFKLS